MNQQPFGPVMNVTNATQNTAVTGSSQSVTFATGKGLEASCVRLVNIGSQTVFVRWGVGAQTATTSDMPLLAGTTEVFCKGLADTLAFIASTTGSTLYVTCGEGS